MCYHDDKNCSDFTHAKCLLPRSVVTMATRVHAFFFNAEHVYKRCQASAIRTPFEVRSLIVSDIRHKKVSGAYRWSNVFFSSYNQSPICFSASKRSHAFFSESCEASGVAPLQLYRQLSVANECKNSIASFRRGIIILVLF